MNILTLKEMLDGRAGGDPALWRGHCQRLVSALADVDLTGIAASLSHSTLMLRSDKKKFNSPGKQVEVEPAYYRENMVIRGVEISIDGHGMARRMIDERTIKPEHIYVALTEALERLRT